MRWILNVNGFESFQWSVFTGGVFIVIRLIFHIADFNNKGEMID